MSTVQMQPYNFHVEKKSVI